MFRTFPTFGAFIFWLLWPWFVVNFTARAYRAMSGKHIPKDRLRALRKSLANNAKAIMKPDSPEKERPVNVSNPTVHKTAKVVLVAAVTATAVSAIFIAGAAAAFRVPKDLRKFIPEKKND